MTRTGIVAAALLTALLAGLALTWHLGWQNTAMIRIEGWRLDVQRDLAGDVRAVRDGGWLAMGPLALLSFIYGILHAAGPGHGKAVIGAYVLADGRRLRRGLAIAWASAMAQALTAVVLMTGAVMVLGLAGRQVTPAAEWLERAGYGLIVVIGAVMVVRPWLSRRRAAATHRHHDRHGHAHHAHALHEHGHHESGHACGHVHADGQACGHIALPPEAEAANWKDAALLVLSVGLRPCSGALLVLTFAAAMGVFAAGVAATFAMAVGTAITVSVLAVLAVGSRHLATAIAGGDSAWLARIETGITVAAGLALMAMGGLFLAASLAPGPALPFR